VRRDFVPTLVGARRRREREKDDVGDDVDARRRGVGDARDEDDATMRVGDASSGFRRETRVDARARDERGR